MVPHRKILSLRFLVSPFLCFSISLFPCSSIPTFLRPPSPPAPDPQTPGPLAGFQTLRLSSLALWISSIPFGWPPSPFGWPSDSLADLPGPHTSPQSPDPLKPASRPLSPSGWPPEPQPSLTDHLVSFQALRLAS